MTHPRSVRNYWPWYLCEKSVMRSQSKDKYTESYIYIYFIVSGSKSVIQTYITKHILFLVSLIYLSSSTLIISRHLVVTQSTTLNTHAIPHFNSRQHLSPITHEIHIIINAKLLFIYNIIRCKKLIHFSGNRGNVFRPGIFTSNMVNKH